MIGSKSFAFSYANEQLREWEFCLIQAGEESMAIPCTLSQVPNYEWCYTSAVRNGPSGEALESSLKVNLGRLEVARCWAPRKRSFVSETLKFESGNSASSRRAR